MQNDPAWDARSATGHPMLISVLTAALIAVFGISAKADTPAEAVQARAGPCAAAIAFAEKARSIPIHLLQAISLTESGRWSDAHGAFVAWPWTVMAEGKGRYHASKDRAIAAVQALQARGVTNIDVGCMQVNLYYHGDSFSSLEEAFDPIHNVAYAAVFLTTLRQERNSWIRAVKEYHSTEHARQRAYKNRVMAVWDALKKDRPVGGRQEIGLDGIGLSLDYLTVAKWPPRDYLSQRQLEAAARARVMQDAGLN